MQAAMIKLDIIFTRPVGNFPSFHHLFFTLYCYPALRLTSGGCRTQSLNIEPRFAGGWRLKMDMHGLCDSIEVF
jgi:hypothetical protein